MSEKADGEAIEIECVWSAEAYTEAMEAQRLKRINALRFRELFGPTFLVMFLGFAILARLLSSFFDGDYKKPFVMFILGGLAVFVALLPPVLRKRDIFARPSDINYRLQVNYFKNRNPHRIRLDPRGTIHRYGDTVVDAPWRDVSDVSEIGAGVVIWRADMVLAILPDEALPAGLDRARLLSRISAWREAARD